jgi:gamma-glutamylputrescine oxidase
MDAIKTGERRWGETPWRRAAALLQHLKMSSPVTNDAKAVDVAIIGGGLTGVSAAYHLAKQGIRSTLFEAVRIGDGASGRTGGLVLEGTAIGIMEEVDSCVAGLKALVAEEGIECDLALPGCWEIDHRPGGTRQMLPWNDGGQPVSIARTVAGGIVQPAALVDGIARAAILRGAEIMEGRPVQRIGFTPQLTLESGGEVIHPGYIVLAMNAWTGAMLPVMPRLRSSLTFAVATEPLPAATIDAIGLGANIPFYTADRPYLWGRTVKDGRVIFGSQLVFGSPAELEDLDVSESESGVALESLRERVRRLHPSLRNVKYSASWGGPIAFMEDMAPLIGPHPSSPQVLVAGAYAGHGVALSVRMGQLLARTIALGTPLPKWGAITRERVG